MRLKLMNYNVLHGFHQTKSPFQLEPKRLKAAQAIVRREKPDILVLTEACYGGPNLFGNVLDYRALFNYRYGYFGHWGHHEWGNSILCK